ncbi:MAG: VWA domain-containing protein [Pseudorhodobacter sp.]|nr:VWA domain-containing protein [Pseudorhodobacter sp.]
MTDDLDIIRAALRDAPKPDPAARKNAIAAAMQNFDRMHQETAAPARPIHDRSLNAAPMKGLAKMFRTLSTHPFLTATTSAAALGLGVVLILPQQDLAPQGQPIAEDVALLEQSEPMVIAETAAAPAPAATSSPAPETAARPSPAPGMTARKMIPSADAAAPRRSAPLEALADFGTAAPPSPVPDQSVPEVPNSDAFANAERNPVTVTTETPVSTFSVDVDTASYAVVRSFLTGGALPPSEAVRIEEMINYFPYAYPAPGDGQAPFATHVTVMPTPWNSDTQLVRIGLQGRLPAVADRPPLNLVFLVDTSGSMQDAAKLPLLKQSLALMLRQLRPEDEVALVAYAGSAGEVLPPTRADQPDVILRALDQLSAGGATAGAEGLELAYRIAEKMTRPGEVSRVLLATDGDFNVGLSDPDGLEAYVEKKRRGGIYLSVLGFGRGNLDDATMQALAQNGNGIAAYIDTLQEARKVLVDQLTGALFPIANDVKIQVEWNPAAVAEYRLIGYETRALAREDFNNDKVDAGEIGAGHAVTALYEVTAPGSPALANDPLRYGEAAAPAAQPTEELGFLRLRYKAPGETKSVLLETPIRAEADSVTPASETNFAAAIAGFGQLLTGATYLGDWGWDEAIALALSARGEDAFGYRAEAISLMRLGQVLDAN